MREYKNNWHKKCKLIPSHRSPSVARHRAPSDNTNKTSWTFRTVKPSFVRRLLFRLFSLRLEPASDTYTTCYAVLFLILREWLKSRWKTLTLGIGLFHTCIFDWIVRECQCRDGEPGCWTEKLDRRLRMLGRRQRCIIYFQGMSKRSLWKRFPFLTDVRRTYWK